MPASPSSIALRLEQERAVLERVKRWKNRVYIYNGADWRWSLSTLGMRLKQMEKDGLIEKKKGPTGRYLFRAAKKEDQAVWP